MAKESMKAREVKRAKLVAKYAEKRAALKKIVNGGDSRREEGKLVIIFIIKYCQGSPD